MKKIISFALLIFSIISFGQAPSKFNYQAVARNTSGNLMINQNISVRVSILTGSVSGTSEYTETHSVTTDGYGVFNILVGGGTVVSGTFAGITWSSASKFLKIEADVTGGTTYQAIATTQILSAPYALYANESGTKTFNDSEFSIVYAGGIADNPPNAPTAVLAGLGSGSVDNGIHDYKVTFITSAGETGASSASGSVTISNNTSNGKILVSGIPVSIKPNVTSRNLYRRFNSTGDYKLLAVIPDNSTTTYIDNISNSALGKVMPVSNGTTNSFHFDGSRLASNQTISIPNSSGTIVLDKTASVPVQTQSIRSLILHGRSVVQGLLNGTYTFGANPGEFAEAYTNQAGKNNSVNNTNYTVTNAGMIYGYRSTDGKSQGQNYSVGIIDLSGSGTISNPDGFGNASFAFDNDLTNSAEYQSAYTNATVTKTFGHTFSSRTIRCIHVIADLSDARCMNQNGNLNNIRIEYFNGTSWVNLTVIVQGSNMQYDSGVYLYCNYLCICNLSNCQGIRVSFDISVNQTTFNLKVYKFAYGDQITDGIISHTIPSGTFSSKISSSIGVPLLATTTWGTGSEIQYKLKNGSDDSGWLNYNTISSFTPFTSEPTQLLVKISPNPINPYQAIPSINGFYVTEF